MDPQNFVAKLQQHMAELKPLKPPSNRKQNIFVHKDLKSCSHVFLRIDRVKKALEPPYEGPYTVQKSRSITSIVEPDLTNLNENRLDNWQKITKIIQLMWKRWSVDYLNSLQQRNKWHFEKKNAKIGDMVIIKEDNLPSCQWSLGRINNIYPGKDSKGEMAFLGKELKVDLQVMATEMGVEDVLGLKVVELREAILNSKNFDEEFCREFLNTIIEERKRKEEIELNERKRKEEIELAEKKRRDRIGGKEEAEERKRIDEMDFDFQKKRIELKEGNENEVK
ncbi:DUF5641 domain-containing protein [Trichonephila clavipes]|nr:DUF5641 domain-containing protein [Trichonephila clavipes]